MLALLLLHHESTYVLAIEQVHDTLLCVESGRPLTVCSCKKTIFVFDIYIS